MKRVWMVAAAGALLLGLSVPAMAQQQPSFTVSFSGEMRIHGFVWDNVIDFKDTEGSANKDSNSFYFQRWRLWTTVQSADKKAKAVWAVEVGDLTWGTGNSPSGNEYGGPSGAPANAGRGAGAGLGADGVNVETKNLYVQFDVPWVPGANLLLGAHNIVFLSAPTLAFMDDDGFGIQFNWKADPVDLQVYTVKIDENTNANADDNDMYVARLGVNVTKDMRFTVEGMVVNQQCMRAPGSTTACGATPNVDFGENFWVGGTVGLKLGTISLDGSVVYGTRQLPCTLCSGGTAEESGFGVQATARVPFGPVNTWFHGWYTTGDEQRGPGTASNNSNGFQLVQGVATPILTKDSDKLPIPIAGASWGSAPFVAEYITGLRTLGSPAVNNGNFYLDPTGLWGIGASGIFALTPALSIGGGVAYVGATEDNAVFGKDAVEIDAGLLYTYNSNLSFQFIAGYILADKEDDAWGASFRTRFAF